MPEKKLPGETTTDRNRRIAYYAAMRRAEAVSDLAPDFGWYPQAHRLLQLVSRYKHLGSMSPTAEEMEVSTEEINVIIHTLTFSWADGQKLRKQYANTHMPNTHEILGGTRGIPMGDPVDPSSPWQTGDGKDL